MEILGKIRRLYLRDGLSLHEITKRTGLSRNTVRSWLRAAETATPPTYRRRKAVHRLTPFHAALEQALTADAHRTKQNRRTVKALLAHIKADGYVGGYSQLTAFIRAWRGAIAFYLSKAPLLMREISNLITPRAKSPNTPA